MNSKQRKQLKRALLSGLNEAISNSIADEPLKDSLKHGVWQASLISKLESKLTELRAFKQRVMELDPVAYIIRRPLNKRSLDANGVTWKSVPHMSCVERLEDISSEAEREFGWVAVVNLADLKRIKEC